MLSLRYFFAFFFTLIFMMLLPCCRRLRRLFFAATLFTPLSIIAIIDRKVQYAFMIIRHCCYALRFFAAPSRLPIDAFAMLLSFFAAFYAIYRYAYAYALFTRHISLFIFRCFAAAA